MPRFPVDRDRWTPELAEEIARRVGIEILTERHWRVIAACREFAAGHGRAPDTQVLIRLVGSTAEQLEQLFPGKPASLVAKVAGLTGTRE